ncbi:hypothetical protein CLOM_g5980 [Closterium sp. NIES-68]|nr:hypothetical protein CLOM_g5980 [Closterium sp. NIES-68]
MGAQTISTRVDVLSNTNTPNNPSKISRHYIDSPTRQEMLAIVHAFKTWRCDLIGVDVTVRTDHNSLEYLRAQPNLNPRQIRWLDFLESIFHYTITYKQGANNIADALT